jgi:hypothetical protein
MLKGKKLPSCCYFSEQILSFVVLRTHLSLKMILFESYDIVVNVGNLIYSLDTLEQIYLEVL